MNRGFETILGLCMDATQRSMYYFYYFLLLERADSQRSFDVCEKISARKTRQALRFRKMLLARMDALEADRDQLKAALMQVEFMFDSAGNVGCAWCQNRGFEGHKPDCPRQAALGLANATQNP